IVEPRARDMAARLDLGLRRAARLVGVRPRRRGARDRSGGHADGARRGGARNAHVVNARAHAVPPLALPRYVRIAGRWINAYKVFLCVGLSVGVLVSAATAEAAGWSPLAVGLA